MATIKQKQAIKKVLENHGNVSKSMKEVGYTDATAKNPKNLTESIGWQELMQQYLPDDKLSKLHKKFLNKKEWNKELVKKQPHKDSLTALDMAYKLKGNYATEKKELTLKNFDKLLDDLEKGG